MKFEPLYLRVKTRLREEWQNAQATEGTERLPTLDELQARYQVSRPTISKALAALAAEGFLVKERGRGTFALVPADAQDTLPAAARLTVGFIAPLYAAELPQSAFRGIDRIAHRRAGRVLMAGAGDSVAQEQAAVQEMIVSGARGLIIYPALRQGVVQANDYLRHDDLGVPCVLMDTCTQAQGHTQVVFDNKRAGAAMTEWLVDRGHRRIGLVFYDEDTHHPVLEARARGHREALRRHGLPAEPALERRLEPSDLAASLDAALDDLLPLTPPPTAIIACDDMVAMDVIENLHGRGLRVPEDVYVAGFDNRVAARRYRPAFTTTNPDFELLGEIACEALLDGIEAGAMPARTYVLPVPLLVRQSLMRMNVRTND